MIGRSERSRGFTVVELIVAMSISAVTLLSAYELLQALKAVGDSQSADLAATARIVHGLGRIREDLLHAVPRKDSQGPIFTGGNADLEGMGETTKVLKFYSLSPGDGDDYLHGLRQICLVSYELVRTEESVCLYRRATPVIGAGQTSGDEDRELILDRVDQVKFAFRGEQGLEPSFSSNEQLPVGVEMTMTAYDQVWPLSVKLPCGTSEGGS